MRTASLGGSCPSSRKRRIVRVRGRVDVDREGRERIGRHANEGVVGEVVVGFAIEALALPLPVPELALLGRGRCRRERWGHRHVRRVENALPLEVIDRRGFGAALLGAHEEERAGRRRRRRQRGEDRRSQAPSARLGLDAGDLRASELLPNALSPQVVQCPLWPRTELAPNRIERGLDAREFVAQVLRARQLGFQCRALVADQLSQCVGREPRNLPLRCS